VAGGDRKSADVTLLAMLAGGSTVAEAAGRAGVSERTAWRRLEDGEFRRRLDEARAQAVRAAVDLLGRSATAAAATLVRLLGEPHPPAVRLGAARAILDLGAKLREAQELEGRLTALEAALGINDGGKP